MTRQDGQQTDDEEAPVFFKTDAERAAKQAAKARQDAGEAGSNVAIGARNLGAAALAGLAEVTAPQDDKKGRRHARKTRAKALKLAEKNRQAAARSADKARGHGAKAAGHGRKDLDRRGEKAGQALSSYAGVAGMAASDAGHRAAEALKERGGHTADVLREQGAHAAEVLREQGGHAAEVLRERSGEARQAVADKAGPAAQSAAEGVGQAAGASAAILAALAAAAREKAAETRARAAAGFDHGLETAVPRVQEGVAAVGPRVDRARDTINEDLLPRLQAMLDEVQAGKAGASAGTKAAAPKGKRKGGFLIALGVLAAAGAGVAYWLAQQSKAPATDPWAQPVTGADPDPWAATAPTTDVPGSPGADMAGTGVTATAPLADAHLTDDELATAAGRSGSGTQDPLAASYPAETESTSSTTTSASTGTSTSGTEGTGGRPSADGRVEMLATDEIDELGRDEGIDVDEQGEGHTPTEEIEAARAQSDQPLTTDRAQDGEDPDTPRA